MSAEQSLPAGCSKLHLGLLAVGAYIGLASDECIRAVGMVLRWKSGKWKNKGLVEYFFITISPLRISLFQEAYKAYFLFSSCPLLY